VQAQDYERVEHIIVSDGPDGVLREKLAPDSPLKPRNTWYLELPEHAEELHWGHLARLFGIEHALGEFITYCDDDDALRPNHCSVLVKALMDNPEAGWAYSQMASHHVNESISVIGSSQPACGSIGTPMIMHRKEILEHGAWGPASAFEDWELVNRWNMAGVKYVNVEEVTSDVWPSAFHGH